MFICTHITCCLIFVVEKLFSCSKKESGSNDISLYFVEFSNEQNNDRNSNATRTSCIHVYKNIA